MCRNHVIKYVDKQVTVLVLQVRIEVHVLVGKNSCITNTYCSQEKKHLLSYLAGRLCRSYKVNVELR